MLIVTVLLGKADLNNRVEKLDHATDPVVWLKSCINMRLISLEAVI